MGILYARNSLTLSCRRSVKQIHWFDRDLRIERLNDWLSDWIDWKVKLRQYSEAVVLRCSVKKLFLKKRLFPWEFCKILSITFLTEHLWWLLLNIVTKKKRKWWLFLYNYFSHGYNIHSIFVHLIGGAVVLLSFAFLCFHLVCVLIM